MSHKWQWAALAVLAVVLWAWNPPALPVCSFRWLTGLPCPLCGLTRGLFALAKGHMGEALRWHALTPLAAAMLVGMVWRPSRMAKLWLPCIGIFVLYGVGRMIS